MENISKDILSLLALELDYPDLLNFCNSSKKIGKVCNTYWTEKSIRDFNVKKSDIIGDPLSFYFGMKNKKGWNWDFNDYISYDLDFEGNEIIDFNPENLNITFYGEDLNQYDYNIYIPGMKIPVNETIFVGFFNIVDKEASEYITVVSKDRDHTIEKLLHEIEYNYWSDVREHININDLNINSATKRKVMIERGYNDNLYEHKIIIALFSFKI